MNLSRASYVCTAMLLATSIVACSGGSGNVPASSNAGPGVPSGPSSVVEYGQELLQGAAYVGPAKVNTLGLDVVVKMQDEAGLLAYARSVNDPKSTSYRHFLGPQQIGQRFGASAGNYNAAIAYFARQGITVKGYPQREMLRLRGSQTAIEAALGTKLAYYSRDGQTFVAPSTALHFPGNLPIVAVGNIVKYHRFRRLNYPVRAGTAQLAGFAPQQIANAFDYTGAYAAGYTGTGINIGIVGTGPITDGDPRIAGGDVAEYRLLFGVSGSGTVTQVADTSSYAPSPGPGSPAPYLLATPPPVTSTSCVGALAGCNPEDVEAQIDTEQASALAPNASVLFYIAYSPDLNEIGLALADDEIADAIAADAADVMSLSFGGGESLNQAYYFPTLTPYPMGLGPTEFASLAAEGIAVFASSGDAGAEECAPFTGSFAPCVSYPATDPSVVSVGGTNTPLDATGRLMGPLTGWGNATSLGAGGSGGGVSAYFPQPAFQTGMNLMPAGNRNQPDIALDADSQTGVAVVINAAPGLGGRQIAPYGGTSVAAPEAAAMWALVLDACRQHSACAQATGTPPGHAFRLGNPNPLFYAIYNNTAGSFSGNPGGAFTPQLTYAQVFYDVLFGNNALLPGPAPTVVTPAPTPTYAPGYSAGVGYDRVTGIGAPYGRNLTKAVTGY